MHPRVDNGVSWCRFRCGRRALDSIRRAQCQHPTRQVFAHLLEPLQPSYASKRRERVPDGI